MTTIPQWPVDERPRERLLKYGAQALSDAELLAIFLRTGVPGKTAVDLARDLIQSFGSIRELLLANQTTFCRHHGLGPAKFVLLKAMLELSRRHMSNSLQRGSALTNPQDVRNLLTAELRDHKQEVFHVLFLDNQHRLIKGETLFFGTINSASVHPREVVRKALDYNAAALIVAHNHPSGVSEPSRSDIDITLKLRDAAALMDIRLLDHFIIGHGESTSLAERGHV